MIAMVLWNLLGVALAVALLFGVCVVGHWLTHCPELEEEETAD